MAKDILSGLQSSQAEEVTNLVICWKIIRTDGLVFGYTNSDIDIIFEGVAYKARTGFDLSDIETNKDLNVDTVDLAGIVGTDMSDISVQDVLAGKWDGAQVIIFQLDRANLANGAMPLRKGWLGEVTVSNKAFKAELRGLMQALQQNIGRVYTVACQADFGDDRCRVAISGYTFHGSVSQVTSSRDFLIAGDASNAPPGQFTAGKITWISGLNASLSMEVKLHTELSGGGMRIELQLGMPYEVNIGDDFSIVTGCDKSFYMCSNLFNNAINFRGFPFIPGMDALTTDIKQSEIES